VGDLVQCINQDQDPSTTSKGEHECTCGWPGSVPTGLRAFKIQTKIWASIEYRWPGSVGQVPIKIQVLVI
jgi:hypothetical protein